MSVFTHILPVEYTPYIEESVLQDLLPDIHYLPYGNVRPVIVPFQKLVSFSLSLNDQGEYILYFLHLSQETDTGFNYC